MKHRNFAIVLLIGAALATSLAAQTAPVAPQSRLDIAITWNTIQANLITGDTFWTQGGSLQLHGRFWRGFGAVADVSGFHTGQVLSTGAGLDLLTVTAGPCYTWKFAHGKFDVFGEGLGGEVFGLDGEYPTRSGLKSTANSVTAKVGGGADLRVARHFAVRPFEAYWLRTQLPNSTTGVQNNLQLGAGLVLRF